MRNYDLLSLGEVLLRMSPTGNERLVSGGLLEKHIGGAECNVVCGSSLLGLRTGVISKLPDNAIGSFAKNCLRSYGVSDEYLVFDYEKDARLGIYYYENGAYPRKPGIVYDRGNSSVNKIAPEDFPEEMYSSTTCFHISGITLALSKQCRDTAIHMMKKFKAAGALISFDVNFRGNLWTGQETKECIEQILPYVDIFFCSDSTARLTFLKEGDTREIMKSFTKDFPISIVASTNRIVHSPKRHTFSSVIYDSKTDTYYEEEPYHDIEVVNRLGSGDAYISGVLYGLLKYQDCKKALEYGNASSAVKNTLPGDISSSDLKEIERIIKDHGDNGIKAEMDR